MEKIRRPKEISKMESNVQNNEYIQKNLQSQINEIYNYLDKVAEKL